LKDGVMSRELCEPDARVRVGASQYFQACVENIDES